ncbi:nuclear transport factor 2 family protein [Aquisediminimonas sediminicola]|uniref:nuclear transport factor 2 family protein n=1 Tax=Alteraquisediminimonas sediminicola TaxID=2676787 RepID=UPI001C8CFB61|nr:nuclear transport factor 2 family protein [Aquisediminimonas sediminicola]
MSVHPPTIADIAARMAITDVLHRYCRAMDRMDRPLALSCWHADGTDEHTPLFAGSAEGFIDWVWQLHAPMIGTRHCLSNIQIEIAGDRAWSESYWDVRLRVQDENGLTDIVGGGRYLDYLECREGQWAIVHRRSVHDWDRVDPVKATMADSATTLEPHNPDAPLYPASRDNADPSYAFLGGHQTRFP